MGGKFNPSYVCILFFFFQIQGGQNFMILYTELCTIITEYVWENYSLDSFNNAYWDEDNILEQIYIKQLWSEIYYDFFKYSFFSITHSIRILNLYERSPEIFVWYVWSKRLSSSLYAMWRQDVISSNTIRVWLHNSV